MLTIEKLQEFGVNTQEGLGRCMGNEGFYLKLVGMAAADGNFEKLSAAIEAGDLDGAFEASHALKGVLGNLSLTPLYAPASEMCELLRARTDTDYAPLLEQLLEAKDALTGMMAE